MDKLFKVSKLEESVKQNYSKKLGVNGIPATIFGYISVPKSSPLFNPKDLLPVYEFAKQEFGDNCKFLSISPKDTLPAHMQKCVKGFSNNSPTVYCLIYQQ